MNFIDKSPKLMCDLNTWLDELRVIAVKDHPGLFKVKNAICHTYTF